MLLDLVALRFQRVILADEALGTDHLRILIDGSGRGVALLITDDRRSCFVAEAPVAPRGDHIIAVWPWLIEHGISQEVVAGPGKGLAPRLHVRFVRSKASRQGHVDDGPARGGVVHVVVAIGLLDDHLRVVALGNLIRVYLLHIF